VEDVIRKRLIRQQIEPSCMDFGKQHYASGNKTKKDIRIKQGIDKDTARKIMADIKASGIKVQAQIMDDQLRVTSKKIDDLQKVISVLRSGNYELPLQFTNMKA
jgi:uncharacterized protein YajQ (UPF0234 family)